LAPEVIQRKKEDFPELCFDEKKNDVFAFGVLVFSAVFLRPPFEKSAKKEDPLFKFVFEKNFEKFWK